ncbi:MAG: Cys-Gln thioester bond-forming surface protein, partial [Erysipelotrichaceae bacterium]|nr:Cys-Gln thioester bond-forming surface protein [Erysipelotrichaceae bacterium]
VGFNSIVFAEETQEPVVDQPQETVVEQAPAVTETAPVENSTATASATATVYVQNPESTAPAESTLAVAEAETQPEKKQSTLVKFVTKADDTKTYQTDVDMELTDASGNTVATWTSKEAPHELILELGDYTLKVVNAPEGYIPGKPVNFSLTNKDVKAEEGNYRVDYSGSGSTIWKQDNSANKFYGYCLNVNRSSSHNETNYTAKILTADLLMKELSPNYSLEGKDIDAIKRELAKVIYNGAGHDPLGLQEKYGLTDSQFRSATQTAVWRVTNYGNNDYSSYTTGQSGCVNELLTTDNYAPDNLDILVFTNEIGRQNMGGAVMMEVKALEVLNLKALEVFASKVTTDNTGLSGATIEIVDADGDVVYTYTSSEEKEGLNLGAGTYIMREVNAPEGYELAEDITFRILEDGSVEILDGDQWIPATDNMVVMIDIPVFELPIIPEEPEKPKTPEEPTPECKEEPKEVVAAAAIQTGAATGTMAVVSMMAMAMAGALKSRKEM